MVASITLYLLCFVTYSLVDVTVYLTDWEHLEDRDVLSGMSSPFTTEDLELRVQL